MNRCLQEQRPDTRGRTETKAAADEPPVDPRLLTLIASDRRTDRSAEVINADALESVRRIRIRFSMRNDKEPVQTSQRQHSGKHVHSDNDPNHSRTLSISKETDR